MDPINIFRQRLNWTRGWLDTFRTSQNTIADDFEIVPLLVESIASSDFGVESLSSDTSTKNVVEDPSGVAAYVYRRNTCTCQEHSSHKFAYHPGSCLSVCHYCTRIRFELEGQSYCSVCNGDCYNNRPKHHPDDAPAIDTVFKADRKELIAYEFTNREADNTFQDLRSASKARKRKRRENEKYFHYKAVKPGWLGKEFYSAENLDHPFGCFGGILLSETPVETMTKTIMYQEAQQYPRPPTYHHRHIDKIRYPYEGRKGWRDFHGRKHANKDLEEDKFEGRVEADFDTNIWTHTGLPWGQDSCALDTEEFFINPRENDWCDDCDVHWSNCDEHQQPRVRGTRCVVDEVDELCMEKDEVTGKMNITFYLDPWEAQRPNRAPAVISYGKRDWVMSRCPEHFTEEDLEW